MGKEGILEQTIRDTIVGLEENPEIGPIVRAAQRFVELTEGRFTPWAEVPLGESIEGLRRYTGQDFDIFSKTVEVLRLVYSPRGDKIPEVFRAI